MTTMTLEQVRDGINAQIQIGPPDEYTLAEWIESIDTHLAKLREAVSEEDVMQACRRYYNSGEKVYAPSYEAMEKALTDFLARRFGEMK